MATLPQDLRHAARMLLGSPGFTLVAVLSLVLGISATTTIFSAIDAILLRPLPYPKSDRLVFIVNTALKQPGNRSPVSEADLVRWRKDNSVFDQIEITTWGAEMNALTGAGVPERIGLQSTTRGLFRMLGVRPLLGHALTDKEAGHYPSDDVAISYEFWQRHFSGDPSILGRSFIIDYGGTAVVTAVLPSGFDLLGSIPADVYRLMSVTDLNPEDARWLIGLGRLKPGITVLQARLR
jgi:putative ABC transport system permease protein